MGILDIGSRVLTTYKADASDHLGTLKKLKGAERDLAEEQIKAAGQRNSQLEDWVKGLGKTTLALGAIAGAVKVTIDAVKDYGDTLRLEAASGSTNIASLQNAFDGLITRHEALAFAAKAQHGQLKLTQAQMELVGRATIALTRAGFDQEEVFKKLQDSVISLKVNGLDDFGLSVKEGASSAETLSNILDALRAKTDQLGPPIESHADDIQRLSVRWADAKANMEEYLAKAALYISSTDNDKKQGFSFDVLDIVTNGTYGKLQDQYRDLYESGIDKTVVGGYAAAPKKPDPWGDTQANITEVGVTRAIVSIGKLGKKFGELTEANKRAKEAAAQALAAGKALASQQARSVTDDLVARLESEQDESANKAAGERAGKLIQSSIKAPVDDLSGIMERLSAEQAQAARSQKGESFLERMFGKKEEFDAYHEMFSGLTSVVTSAYDAWIDGSMSVGEAIKGAVKNVLKSLGERMLVRSLEEFAEGVAALALGPIGGASASQHFAAAGLFASGAALAGVAAKSLSSGSAGTSAGASSGAGSSSISSAGKTGPAQQVTYYIVGDPGGDNSPRQQQANFQRVQQRVQGAVGVRFE